LADLALYGDGGFGEGPMRNDAAEMATVGTVLLLRNPAPFLAKLQPEDFYRPAHRHIWRAMQLLVADRLPVDLVTLPGKLKDLDLLDHVGGHAYLHELDVQVPSTVNREAYAGMVLDKWARRALLSGLSEAESAIRQSRPFSEIGHLLRGLDAAMLRARPPMVEETWSAFVAAQDLGESVGGVPTGNAELDALLEFGGFTNGQITLIMAGSGEGKTTWGLGAVFAACDRGERCAILTFADNDKADILRRALRWKCGIPDLKSATQKASVLRSGGYAQEADSLMRRFKTAQDDVYRWSLFIYDVAADDEGGTYELARAWLIHKIDEGVVDRQPVRLAMWDYAQEINVGSPDLLRLPFYQQQAWIARDMARFCRNVGFPFLVPVQFSKNGEREEVAECKVWEKVCENWIRVYSDDLGIRKRRRGGATAIKPRHYHDADRWAFVPYRASGEAA